MTIDPVKNMAAVTPSDVADLPSGHCRGLYVGTAGDVKVDLYKGATGIIIKNLVAGMVHPISVTKVYSTGTTALDILACF